MLLVTPRFPRPEDTDHNGLTTYTRNAALALREAGAEVEVLAFNERRPDRCGVATEDGFRVHRHLGRWHPLVSRLAPGIPEARRLRRQVDAAIGDREFLAVECPNLDGCGWALMHRRPDTWLRMHTPELPAFMAMTGPTSYRHRFTRYLDRLVARRAVNLVTHSRAHAEAMRAEYRLGDRRIHVVQHGVPDPGLRSGAAVVRGRILCVGPLWLHKGADLVLRAFVEVAADEPALTLTLVGENMDPAVRALLDELGSSHPWLGERLALPGRLPSTRLEAEWNAAEMVIVASRYESFSLVAVEALARGVPLVASDAGALPEVVGEAALTFPSGDAGSLALRIRELAGHPASRSALARQGRQRYLERFGLPGMGTALLDLFRGGDRG